MSYTQDYFPPNGTKYKWNPKGLNYSPWTCYIWKLWPASIFASVDKVESGFKWRVDAWGWHNEGHSKVEGIAKSALSACLAAEKCAEKQKSKLWKPWMEEAVKAGWRS